jgi:glycosyltransferase involved in cell wall biosynthesis
MTRARPSPLRIFVAAPALPKPDEAAGDRRLFALLEILAKRHRVDLWAAERADVSEVQAERYVSLLTSAGVNVLPSGWSGFARAMFRACYHAGLFEFYWMAERLGDEFRRRQPGAAVVVDSVDVHFAREVAGADIGVFDRATAEETRRRELAVYRSADGVVVASDPDGDILRRERDIAPLFLLPIILPIRPRRIGARQPNLLFIGGFNHRPNVDGLLWFVDRSWPLIRASAPDAALTVIGSHPPPGITALDGASGIRVLGYVPDTSPFLDQAAISIAPLRYGAGMKGKVIEAFACGIPVVSTSVGVQGINVTPGQHAAVADEPIDFARAVSDLLHDPERAARIGIAGQELAAELCAPDRIEQLVDGMLHSLVPNPKALRLRLEWLGSVALHSRNALGRKILATRSAQSASVER